MVGLSHSGTSRWQQVGNRKATWKFDADDSLDRLLGGQRDLEIRVCLYARLTNSQFCVRLLRLLIHSLSELWHPSVDRLHIGGGTAQTIGCSGSSLEQGKPFRVVRYGKQ